VDDAAYGPDPLGAVELHATLPGRLFFLRELAGRWSRSATKSL